MTSITIASDNITGKSADTTRLAKIVKVLENAGYTVKNVGVGPGKVQDYMLKSSHKCDVMIQVAGGRCLGTLVDFMKGIRKGTYYATHGGFMYYGLTDSVPDWICVRAHDDNFSSEADLKPYLGKKLDYVYKQNSDIMTYSYNTTDPEAMANMWVNTFGGSAGSSADSSSDVSGASVFDAVKEVCNDWNDTYGIEMSLDANVLSIKRMTTKNAGTLKQEVIGNDTVTINEFDESTPNSISFTGDTSSLTLKDDILIKLYEENPVTTEQEEDISDSIKIRDAFAINRRDHSHSIDLKVLLDEEYQVGKWVQLDLPYFGVNDYYYITKATYENDIFMSLTLEIAAPNRHQEKTETETDNTSDGLTTMSGDDCTDTFSIATTTYDITKTANHKIGNSSANYATDTSSMSGKEALMDIYNRFKYKTYSNNRTCPQKMWASSGKIYGNCADISRLMMCVGQVHGMTIGIHHMNNHYYPLVQVSGKTYRIDPCCKTSGTYNGETTDTLVKHGGPWS